MLQIKKFIPSSRRAPQEIVAVHLTHDHTFCARLRHSAGDVLLLAADCLPPITTLENARALSLPKKLQARYVAVCLPSADAIVKLLNLPGQLGDNAKAQVRENMGIGDADFRIGYRVINPERHSRVETKILTAGIPEPQAQVARALFPVGVPAPIAIEVDGLAAMTAFAYGPAKQYPDETIGCIYCDTKVTFMAFFQKDNLLLVRKIDFGSFHLLEGIQENLGVDNKTAQAILAGGSFDVSQIVKRAIEPFIKQLAISKHFIERRENCHVSKMFTIRDTGISTECVNEIKANIGVDVEFWDPLEAVKVQSGALASAVEPLSARLITVIGAALGLFKDDAP